MVDFLPSSFRTKTPTPHSIFAKITFKIAYFTKMRQTRKRFLRIELTQKKFANLKIFSKKAVAHTDSVQSNFSINRNCTQSLFG